VKKNLAGNRNNEKWKERKQKYQRRYKGRKTKLRRTVVERKR